jgi:hypothetical protein
VKTTPLSHLVLGVWLGGSVILGTIVAYNFSGIGDLFDRNPKLQLDPGLQPILQDEEPGPPRHLLQPAAAVQLQSDL